MSDNMKKIFEVGFVPLLVVDDAQDAVPFARALAEGGVPIAEVTFRTDAAAEVIRRIAAEVPEVLVGAGTVHNTAQAEAALAAGARFIVTPGFNPEVVRFCLERGVDVVPGTVSPADLEQALALGLSVCKFFPAEAYGGVKTLKALQGPYAQLKFLPTGGVNAANMNEYLALPNVAAVGGSFMAPDELVKAKAWGEISALCRRTVLEHLDFGLLHVGINTRDEEDARGVTGRLRTLFGLAPTEFPGAFFAGSLVEVLKGKGRGAMGHIAISTPDPDRAAAYLASLGVEFEQASAAYGPKGLDLIYLAEEIGGFAVHLRRRD